VLFEGGEAAVAAQVTAALALVGGAEADDEVWKESRERQAAAQGLVRFPPGDLAALLADLEPGTVVRAGSGVAYIPSGSEPQPPPRPLGALHERIRAAFDPAGILE